MNVMLRRDWQDFVDRLVESGRFGSATEVVAEALLLQEREAKLQALRDTLEASIAEGGSYSDEEVAASIDAADAELAKQDTLRNALVEGEESGPSAPFDFDAFIAGKRKTAAR